MAEKLKHQIEFQALGVARLKGQYKELESRTRRLEGSTKRAGKSMGGMVAALGITTTALYVAMRAMSAMVRVGKDFEQNMANVAAISGATGQELANLENNARKLGETTVFTASQVAELQTEFAKLGFSSKEITGVTKDTLALAAATQADLGTAAAVAGQTLRAFGLDVNETSRITDTMALSFSSSALDMDKFTNSMQYVAPVAKQVGLSVESTTAMLGAMANAGISGSMAGTSLRKILLELGNENSKLTKRIGFSVKTSDDMVKAFKQLSEEGLTTAEMKDMVGQRAISAFGILLDGVGTVDDLTESLKNSGGAAQEMADIQLNTLQGRTTLMSSAMEGLGLAFFDFIDGPLNAMVSGITSLTQGMTQFLKFGVDGFIKAEGTFNDALSKAHINATELRSDFDRLTKSLLSLSSEQKLSNTQLERRNDVVGELEDKFGNYFKNLDVEKQGYSDIAKQISAARKALEEYMNAQIAQATAKVFEVQLAEQQAEMIKWTTFLERSKEMGSLFAFENLSTAQAQKLFTEEIKNSEAQISLLTDAYKKAIDAAGQFKTETAPSDIEDGGDDGGGVPGDITPEMSREQLAIYQQYLSQRATLFGEDTEMQLTMVDDQTNKLLELFQQQGMDINDVLEFYGKKREQILLAEQTAMLGHYSQMASGFASFLGEFAGAQKAAARLQQVAAAIDAYATANALMADPKLVALYPANLIAAGAALASGLANVMQISKSIGEFTTAATGFEGIVDRPTMFMTGEGGKREHVSVTPLEAPNLHGPQGGNTITVNISAPLVDETVIDQILPAIENAKRFDLA